MNMIGGLVFGMFFLILLMIALFILIFVFWIAMIIDCAGALLVLVMRHAKFKNRRNGEFAWQTTIYMETRQGMRPLKGIWSDC